MTQLVLDNRPGSLEEIRWSSEKCVRCNMCKFPPLARVESKAHSMGCPAYEAFKVNASSGGGMVVMANSLLAGRSRVTPAVRDVVYGCTLCGLCDVSCKYNTDIEVLEILMLLRHRLFREGMILDSHRAVLEHIRTHGHPLVELGSARSRTDGARHTPGASTLVWVGPHFGLDPGLDGWRRSMLDLLDVSGLRYQLLLEDEPYSGRAALEIGDRELFRSQSKRVSKAIRRAGAKTIICLSAEDYSTLRSQTPKFAPVDVEIRHVTESYITMLGQRRFRPRRIVDLSRVAWHDPCYLGRLGGRFRPWQGTLERVGGIKIYAPRRPIDYGSGGVFEAPRRVLTALGSGQARELSRRKEYAFNAGETGQTWSGMPAFALETACRRLQEAIDCGVDTLVTECPQAQASLSAAASEVGRVEVRSLTELLVQSLERNRS